MSKLLEVIPGIKGFFLFFVSMCLTTGAAIAAAAPTQAQGEIKHLLAFVQASGCRFNRSGTWYSSQDARQHLQMKYEYLSKETG